MAEFRLTSETQAAVLNYMRGGLVPVPIPSGQKGPTLRGWPDLRIGENDIAAYFPNGENVGLILGAASGGLVDVDLDSPEAVTLASSFLPATERIHGRATSLASHRWYRTNPVVSPEKFSDPNGACLVEIRSTGQQTVVPPSTHPSGEILRWEREGKASEVEASELRRGVSHLAAATLLARSWPSKGGRHEAALAIAGWLIRAAWSVDDTRNFIWFVAKAAGDEEWSARGRDVESTAKRLAANGAATGASRLIELMGSDAVSRAGQWLDLRQAKDLGESAAECNPNHMTDWGNARRLVGRHGKDIRFCHSRSKWLVWSGTRWAWDDSGEIERRAKDTVGAIYQEAANETDSDRRIRLAKWAASSESDVRLRAMVGLSKSEPGVPVAPGELDSDAWLLNCDNGSVDLRTGELHPHRRGDLCTKLAPVNYEPEAKCPLWLGFLHKIMGGNTQLIEFLQRASGYGLTGSTKEQVLFLLYGTGANGKTTYLEANRACLGDYARTTDFSTLLTRVGDSIRNDLARLDGARVVSAVEAEAGKRLSESLVKSLTGEDTIAARFLYGEYFEFRPRFKLFLAANHKPVIKGTDSAIWRRIRLVPFKITIPEDERDKDLLEKLCSELPAILAWLVRGCLAWQREGLDTPTDVVNATDAYREEMDSLGDFLAECCDVAPAGEAAAGELYKAYGEWCEANGEHPLGKRNFGLRLSERGFERGRGTGGARFWKGISVRSDASDAR